jgi:23S rRNA (uracil1939-C5)-methyltransferase
MGFRKASSSDIVDIRQCPILVPHLEALLPEVRTCLSELDGVRHLGHVELVQANNGPLMVLRHTAPLSKKDREKLERFSHSHELALFLAPQSEILEQVTGDAPWYASNGLRLTFSPRDFIQVNDGVNQKMIEQALSWLDVQKSDRVLDLFCGMGNFTLPLAQKAASVVGVEGVEALVAKGQENARQNGLQNVTFFHQNLEEDVTQQPWATQGFDKILLDPPGQAHLA